MQSQEMTIKLCPKRSVWQQGLGGVECTVISLPIQAFQPITCLSIVCFGCFFPTSLISHSLLQLIDVLQWDLMEFLQVALVNIALNQVWTALLIWLIVTFPRKSFRLSPVLSAVAGFTSGFFIPISRIPSW